MCKRTNCVYDLASSLNYETLNMMSDAYMLSVVMEGNRDVKKEDWLRIFDLAKRVWLDIDNEGKELAYYIQLVHSTVFEDNLKTLDELEKMGKQELINEFLY